jgi:hypothetical protein
VEHRRVGGRAGSPRPSGDGGDAQLRGGRPRGARRPTIIRCPSR